MTDTTQMPHPALPQFNPYEPAQCRDPFPMYAYSRQNDPIFYSPVLKMWVATRYEDICEIVQDTARFSNRQTVRALNQMPPQVLEILATGFPSSAPLVGNDPPAHTRVRRLVNKAFTPQRVASMEPRIRQWTNELVDVFVGTGTVDLQTQFAYPLPRTVIADIVGVPRADIDKFGKWSEEWTRMLFTVGLPVELQIVGAQSAVALQRYAEAMIIQRREQPQDDLLSDLVHSQLEDGSVFDTVELIGLVNTFLIAGHLTTSDMLGNALLILLGEPKHWQALCSDVQIAPKLIEEVLRRDSSVPGMMREAVEDISFHGVSIAKGSRIFLAFSSANHDETLFSNPTQFDIERENLHKHLSFGQGIHFCIGAQLARLEGQIALEVLSQRLPNLRLKEDQQISYTPSLLFRGPDHLHVTWDVA